ncbi:dTDP-4-dehydrorhamnose reductase family protein [Caballeronia arationis]|uniref:dTDP-4-dehydrorhamnose reductase family protein n=1 Tax=Caballeronia arationis TaxID=1777142 RepID=UPI000788E512|nr:SDR family oxidoreductase [Caballeronia arationis]
MKILVLGATGMLGRTAFKILSETKRFEVHGTVRSANAVPSFKEAVRKNLLSGVDVLDNDSLVEALRATKPDAVLNCVGLVKQLASADDPLSALPINAMFPHRLARLCALAGARLIHVSTDCVFSGKKGDYIESDLPDAYDLYGRSKLLGEVDYPNAVTLRTSIIGPEVQSQHGLVAWFLNQSGCVRGFTNAKFSGLTTDELTNLIIKHVLPAPDINGVWHVSADPISKHDLLLLIREVYNRDIEILPDGALKIDRSLNSERFKERTGYIPPTWSQMITSMSKLEEK